MNAGLLVILVTTCILLFLVERMRIPTTLNLDFKGDIKRESRWLAQYGQSVCTPVAALLVWQLDPHAGWKPLEIIAAVLATSGACAILKRSLGRVRPGRENAGKFLGPSLKHSNHREAFPSS